MEDISPRFGKVLGCALGECHATNSTENLRVEIFSDGTLLTVYDGASRDVVFTAQFTGFFHFRQHGARSGVRLFFCIANIF